MPRMKDLIIDSILSVKTQLNPNKRKNVFEIFGYDFLIDEDFRIWLIEVNTNPYLGIPNTFIGKIGNHFKLLYRKLAAEDDG